MRCDFAFARGFCEGGGGGFFLDLGLVLAQCPVLSAHACCHWIPLKPVCSTTSMYGIQPNSMHDDAMLYEIVIATGDGHFGGLLRCHRGAHLHRILANSNYLPFISLGQFLAPGFPSPQTFAVPVPAQVHVDVRWVLLPFWGRPAAAQWHGKRSLPGLFLESLVSAIDERQ